MKAIKQALDRWAIAAAAKAMRPPPERPHPGSLPAGEGSAAPRAAEFLRDPDFLVPPSGAPAFAPDANGRFSFASSVATGSARNDTVHGRFFPAPGAGAKPLMVLAHGWNAELFYLYGFPRLARGLNRRGIDVLAFELPYHLKRRPREPGVQRDFISADLGGMLLATRQAVADMEALLGWAKAQGATRTGLWGFSLGGWLAGLHLSHSPNATCGVFTTPISNLRLAVETLPFCLPVRRALEANPMPLDQLNLGRRPLKVSPENILLTEALYDQFVPASTYAELAGSWNLKEWQKVPQSHLSILLSRKSMAAAMDWLRVKLGGVSRVNGGGQDRTCNRR